VTAAKRPVLVIATTNIGKFHEFCELLGDLPLELRSLTAFPGMPAVAEEGDTYAANAACKARAVAAWARCAALADDSGLEVAALGGAPGVHSARYAGPAQDSRANVAKLVAALRGVPAAGRAARFRCVIAVACVDGATRTAEGTCAGVIGPAPRGGGGFGYDPVFVDPASGLTFAEMPAAVKNRVSHRARACAALRPQLLAFLAAHGGG
jgi:XTP/dITP diphosphohydrolase